MFGFINYTDNNKDVITDWLASYVHYEDAKRGFERTFTTAYKNRFPHSKKKRPPDFDLSVEFAASKALKRITKDGFNTLAASTNQTSRHLEIKMTGENPYLAAAESSILSSSTPTPTPTPTSTYWLENNVEVVEPLRQYIHYCKQ